MGLTKSSVGKEILEDNSLKINSKTDFVIALAGNPNVGKSTIFNALTGMHQHTGNWPGKTVANAIGETIIFDKSFSFVDIPGTYSILSNSEEEEIARDYICFGNPDLTVVVVDSTCLERNLNLVFQIMEITDNIILCVNLLDEAKKKKIKIDLEKLSKLLGVPVVGTSARDKKTLESLKNEIYSVCRSKKEIKPVTITYSDDIEETIKDIEDILKNIVKNNNKLSRWISLKLLDNEVSIIDSIEKNLKINLSSSNIKEEVIEARNNLNKQGIKEEKVKENIINQIVKKSEDICKQVCTFQNNNYGQRDKKIDKILTSKTFGIPLMILFLGVIFWITIIGANYPSELLFKIFMWFQDKLLVFADFIHVPEWLSNMLIYGVYQTLIWIISVMLPPMAIFFPLFTILEDFGYLPRIAFNMDGIFKKACCSGKQMITMCMGFGCNAAGVVGCRIINSPRERLIAILTNAFVPCNGRFPFLITIATIFIAGAYTGFKASIISTLVVVAVILMGIILTLIISKILSKTILKGMPSSMVLELPPYRKPQFKKIIIRSIFDRTIFVLGRAISIAAPAGLVIWIFANVLINGASILDIVANFLNPFAQLMGLDGYILTAFIFGIPANEIVLPIILMCYLGANKLENLTDTFSIGKILINNGWTIITAINTMIFTVLHFPCGTTLLTIKKETKSFNWVAISFILPTICRYNNLYN